MKFDESLKRGTRLLTDPKRHSEEPEEKRGHNHPASVKCGPYCPRNEHYKGRKKKFNPFSRNT